MTSNATGSRRASLRRGPILSRLSLALPTCGAVCLFLSGCAVYSVVDTAVDVTATAVETTADVAGGVVSGAAGVVAGDDDDDRD